MNEGQLAVVVELPTVAIDERKAFEVYLTTGGRSLRKTAQLLGLPHGTVLSWNSRHNWQQRKRDMDLEVIEGIAEAGAVAVIAQQLRNVETLVEIRDNPEEKAADRVKAAKTLMGEFKDIKLEVAHQLAQAQAGLDELSEDEYDKLAETAEGVEILLQRQRKRQGT